MLARSFWLRFLAWSAALAAVAFADAILNQFQGGGVLSPGILLRVAELGVGARIDMILGFGAFAAAVAVGATGIEGRKLASLGLLVGAGTLVVQGYLLPLSEWLAWHQIALPHWEPMRAALPLGAVPAQSTPTWWARASSHFVEASSLQAALLTVTGALVGRWTGAIRDPLRQLLPWTVGLLLFAATRLAGRVIGAIALGVLQGTPAMLSPWLAVYSILTAPLAVLGTLLWVRCAEATRGPEGGAQP